MRAHLNYALALLGVVIGCLLTYKYLNQPGVGLLNWAVIGVLFVGAFMAFRKAEQVRD